MITRVLILVLLVAMPTLAEEPSSPRSRIVFDEMVHDFGIAAQNAPLRHVFRFRNTGTAILKIDRVQTTCGCTAASLAQKEIGPGQASEIDATLNTQNYTGGVSKTIQVFTNDPDNKSISLQLKANVTPEIVCTPPHLDFGEITVGTSPELVVKVSSSRKKRFAITGVASSLGFVKPRFDRSGDGEFTVSVKIENPSATGPFAGSITIRTDLDEPRELKVTFAGSVTVHTYASPEKLLFGVVKPGGFPSRDVMVRTSGWEGLKVESVKATGSLGTTAEETTPGKEWKITVRVAGSLAPGLLKGELRIAVNDPLTKEIVVPVYAVVSESP